MDSSGRQPPKERVGEKILQETHQNRQPSASSNQKRPVTAGGSNGKGTPSPHSHGTQKQSPQKSVSKPTSGSGLDSPQVHGSGKRQGVPDRGLPQKAIVMKPTTLQEKSEHMSSSSSTVKPSIPKVKGHQLANPGMHRHSSSKEHETTGRQKQVSNATHMLYKLGEKSLKAPPLRGQKLASSSTPKFKDQISSPEGGKTVTPKFKPLSSTYAKPGTEQGPHEGSKILSNSKRREEPASTTKQNKNSSSEGQKTKLHVVSNSNSRHGESSSIPPRVDTVKDGCKSHQSSNHKDSHHNESSNKPHHREQSVKDREKSHVSQERSKHQSESSMRHHNKYTIKDGEKSQVPPERSRNQSGSSSKIDEVHVDTVKETRKSQEVPQPRSSNGSASCDRLHRVDAVSDRQKTPDIHVAQQRQRSQSESSSKYNQMGIVKRRKSSEASRAGSTKSSPVLHAVSKDEDMVARKKKNTMMWLLNSTSAVEDDQTTPPKPVKRKTQDQTVPPNADGPRGSFIVVQDKAGWTKRIYSDGSSGVTSGMEPAVGRSYHSSGDSSGCQKRHAEGSKELHIKKKSKLHRINSSSSVSHQAAPTSYGALLSMAKQNLSNGQQNLDSKISDKVPERIRRNSHQSGSDPEQQPSCRSLQQGLLKCDFDEEKVERLFKASLSARPKIPQQSTAPVDKQKVRKQASVESQASSDSFVNSSNSIEKISLEKVERLFNASLNTISKTAESPKIETKAAKCPLEEAQSPVRPEYTCALVGSETTSEQSDNRITMSFRKVPLLSKKSLGSLYKKPLGSHLHKFREKSIKRLLMEASSRAVHIPLKRLQLKSDRIFLTDDTLRRLGRSSSIIVNTARKHNIPHGKKMKGQKHKPRRRALPLCSSSDPDTPSFSNNHRALLQVNLPLRQAMSDSAALSESSASSGVANLFQELSSDPSKMDQPSDSSSARGLQGRSRVTTSPKFSGSISKLKQRIGKRLQAAVHGDRPGCSHSGNESDSTMLGSSSAEGYQFGDSEYIPFGSGIEDVIFEETVATESDERMGLEDGGDQGLASMTDEPNINPQIDSLAEPMVSGASEGNPSPASATSPNHTTNASQGDPCDLTLDKSENHHTDENCVERAADGALQSDGNVVPSGQPLSDGVPTTSVTINAPPALVAKTNPVGVMPVKSEKSCTDEDATVPQTSQHPSSSPSGQAKATAKEHTGEMLADTTDPPAELEERCSGDAHDDSESLPDVDLNAGDEDPRDAHENSSDSMEEMDFDVSTASIEESQPENTPTTIMKEVSQIGNVPLPGTPSKPYPFPLNDSMSPGRLSQEKVIEETTTKKRKLRFSLDKMVDMKRKTDNYEAIFNRLKQEVSQGGFARQMEEQQKTGDADHDDGSGDETVDQEDILSKNSKEFLKNFDVSKKKKKIPIVHPGESIFDQTKLRQIFNYADHMASLAGCGFKPDKPSALESLMLKATPDEMVEMLRTFAVEMAYHSKPCPPAFMLWLFRLMSVHTDCNVVNKAYQTMWSILNSWPIQHPDVVPWAPSVSDLSQILVNYGASFSELLPPGLVRPDFEENDIRLPNGGESINQETERVQPSSPDLTDAEKARYHGNNLMKVIKILTLTLITRKTVDRFPYSEEGICCLVVLVCKASLEKYFVTKAVENDFSLCLVALFECVPETSWKSQAERLCRVLPHVASHHHNLVYITHLMPGCSERGRYMSRQLAYMCLKKLSDGPEQIVNGFYSELKVQNILDIVPATRPHKDTDYYKLHSMIQILDLAIGNEALDKTEKEPLQSLNNKLKLFVSDIKEKASDIRRSQVKDLLVRTTLRLTLMDQTIRSDQVNLFNRMLPLTRIKEENIEEHFPQSQEDAVSISSEEGEEEDKLAALDEDEEAEEDHAREAAHSPAKS